MPWRATVWSFSTCVRTTTSALPESTRGVVT